MKNLIQVLVVAFLFILATGPCGAESSPEMLAAESEAAVLETIKQTPTMPATIITKVNEACSLLEEEGPAAFAKFKGKGSPFLFDGTYIWIHTLKETTMLMHPIKYKMEGKELLSLKDEKGKQFFVAMNTVVNEKGQGWVGYYWPVPGTTEIVHKISFVKKCVMAGGIDVVIGSGIYNGDPKALAELEIR